MGRSATYDAFLSHSRDADADLCQAVEIALRNLGKPWFRRESMHVFRDYLSLTPGPDLRDRLARALDESRCLLLFASEAAAASPWVDFELDYWLRAHQRPDRLIILLTQGDAVLSVPGRIRMYPEPLYVDLRPFDGTPQRWTLSDPQFFAEMAGVSAAIRGISKDQLLSADYRTYRKNRRTGIGVIIALVMLSVVTAMFAVASVRQGGRLESARQDAVQQRNAAMAESLLGQASATYPWQPDVALQLRLVADELRPGPATRAAMLAPLTKPGDIAVPSAEAPDAVTVDPRDRILALRCKTGVRLWDRERHVSTVRLASAGAAGQVTFSQDSSLIAIESLGEPQVGGSELGIWNVADPYHPHQVAHFTIPRLRALAFQGDARLLGLGADGQLSEWGLTTGHALVATKLRAVRVALTQTASFDPTGRVLALNTGRTVTVWDLSKLPRVTERTIAGPGSGAGSLRTAVAAATPVLGPGGHLAAFVTAGADPSVYVAELSGSAPQLEPLVIPRQSDVRALAFSSDGRSLAAARADARVTVWTSLGVSGAVHRPQTFFADATGLAFASRGEVLVTVHAGVNPRLYPVSAGIDVTGRAGGPGQAAFSPDGTSAVVTGDQPTVWQLSAQPRAGEPRVLTGVGAASAVAVSADGTTTAVGQRGGVVRVWEHQPTTGRLSATVPVGFPVEHLVLSPSGRSMVAIGSTAAVVLNRGAEPTSRWRSAGSTNRFLGIRQAVFAPNGKTLLLVSDQGSALLYTFDDRKGASYQSAPSAFADTSGPKATAAAYLSQDQFALANTQGAVTIWQLPKINHGVDSAPVQVGRFSVNDGVITTLTSAGAGAIAVGTAHGASLWQLGAGGAGTLLEPLATTGVTQLTYLPADEALALVTTAGRLELETLDPVRARQRICAIVGTELASEDWRYYLQAPHAPPCPSSDQSVQPSPHA